MDRDNLYEIKNFKKIHDYLTSILLKTDYAVKDYLKDKRLFRFLVKQSFKFGTISSTNKVTYSLVYDFFEETKNIGFRENQISFNIWLRVYEEIKEFDYIISEIENSGKIISKIPKYKNLKDLPNEIMNVLDTTPSIMISSIDDFFKDEFILKLYMEKTKGK
jgi:hypothetical protein